ncbi:hypothetical protein [Streptomyces sp. 7N604]
MAYRPMRALHAPNSIADPVQGVGWDYGPRTMAGIRAWLTASHA